ncbi:Caspase-8 [Pseudolycoriella hygida]|uniref:Caspase-8 n=1 Tax=Pseudolycoriella hygida TaxID=35572 RepID=A0A9Q0RXH0_9DIPT|nr:Caspase-8 [Pseudolycoriella hygida]
MAASIIFLLYGDNPVNAKIGLQRLLVLYHAQNSQTTDIITQWILSQNDSQWRTKIVEILWTIKAKHVLQSLGLEVQDLQERFLDPSALRNAEISLQIHPILKGLYCICEQLEPIEAKQLIEFVYSKDDKSQRINFADERYLEVFLLHWLSELVIEAGQWFTDKTKRNVFCNVEVIIEFLNLNKPNLAKLLRNIVIRFNFTSNNRLPVDRKKNVTDDDGNDDHLKSKKSQSTEERPLVQSDRNIQNGNDNADRYRVERGTAGYVLIINQDHLPAKPLDRRDGTNKDKNALCQTFSAVGYEIVERTNLTNVQILSEVENIVKRSASSDSLIVCILSHGSKGVVYGSNSLPVKIDDIQERIVSKELLNKPKILIIQSCQGEEFQIAQPIEDSFTNSMYLASDGVPIKTVPMRCDFFVAMSTIPGYASIRHIIKGSWFIQALCKTIDNESHRKHFIEIMTMVKKEVTELRGDRDQCMVPICEDTFRKYFYFPTKMP